jgi:energy-coupling factor transporter transmembrane protein EcfT
MKLVNKKGVIDLEIEKSRLNREKSILVLNKSILLYFSFLFIGIIGFINNYVSRFYLNILVLMGLIVLIIGIIPYIHIMNSESKNINSLIKKFSKDGGF